MNKSPLVSIITVNYKQAGVTAEMLRSLQSLRYEHYEVIVVDNELSEPCAHLQEEFPFITYVPSPVNSGFAGGNNLGLRYAKGEYVFFVNNDTEVTPDLLTTLVAYLQQHPQCGMACPKILFYHQPGVIQYAGAMGLHPLTSRSYDIGFGQQDDGRFNECRRTDLPNGAAMLVPMELIREVGPMSEMFFLYYEELDWAARFKEAGYEVHYVGTATIHHKESVSTGRESPFKTYYLYRNRMLYIRRNYKGVYKWIGNGFFALVSIPAHLFRHATKREWQHAAAILRALRWNVRHRPFEKKGDEAVFLRKGGVQAG